VSEAAPTRDQFLVRLDAAHRRNIDRLTQSSDEKWGEWSTHDMLTHFEPWQRWIGVWLTGRRGGREPTNLELYGERGVPAGAEAWNTDQINTWLEQEGKLLDYAEALARYEASYRLVRLAVEKLTDADLAAPASATNTKPLWRVIGGESFLHQDGHLGPSAPADWAATR
jgi:hypothetical protein